LFFYLLKFTLAITMPTTPRALAATRTTFYYTIFVGACQVK